MARKYGTGADQHVLYFEQDQPSETAEFLLAGPTVDTIDGKAKIEIVFGNLPAVDIETFTTGRFGQYGNSVAGRMNVNGGAIDSDLETGTQSNPISGLPGLDMLRFKDVEAIEIRQGTETLASFGVDQLATGLAALNACSQDLITYWGLDVAEHRALTKRPVLINERAFYERIINGYPSDALRAEQMGTIRFLLIVGQDGKVEDCRESHVSLADRLDPKLCRAARRARFEPALNAEGQPMRSYFLRQVSYVIP